MHRLLGLCQRLRIDVFGLRTIQKRYVNINGVITENIELKSTPNNVSIAMNIPKELRNGSAKSAMELQKNNIMLYWKAKIAFALSVNEFLKTVNLLLTMTIEQERFAVCCVTTVI